MVCKEEGCGKKLHIDNKVGYCRPHRHHSPLVKEQNAASLKKSRATRQRTQCIIEGCEKLAECKQMCAAHYQRQRLGMPLILTKTYNVTIPYGSFVGDDNEYLRQWRRRNPESILKDRLIRAGIIAPIIQNIDRELLYEVSGGVCYLCGYEVDPDNWDLEHIQPLSKGGSHSYSNVAVSCDSCNSKKHARTLIEFVPILLREIKENEYKDF